MPSLYKKIISKIIKLSDTINIEEKVTDTSTISKLQCLISQKTKTSVHTIMKKTLMPDITFIGEKITSDTKTMKQTIIIVISNVEEVIAQIITNIKQTILLDTIKTQNAISGTTNIKITIFKINQF
jgi:hypothetical protein